MKLNRFSEEQIIAVSKVREAGMPTADVCLRLGISSATFHKWKSKYGGLELSDALRLPQLEQVNDGLKTLLADLMLDNAMLELISARNSSSQCQAEVVVHLQEVVEASQRRACAVRGVEGTVVRYGSRWPDDAKARERIRELTSQRPWFGYGRLHCYYAGRDGESTTRSSEVYIRRESYRCAVVVVANGLWEHRHRWRSHKVLIGAGPGLRVRFLRLRRVVPDLRCGRGLQPGMRVPDRRHVDLRRAGRAPARCGGLRAHGAALNDRQR